MAAISYATQEINAKIVYYGPGLSGKTTNLRVIYENVQPNFRSNMISLSTEGERTLFFDFLPLDLGKIKGFKIKLQLYTVPGQVYYNATRKLVLRGVDGIVFVADSTPDKMEENLESLQNLYDNLYEYRYRAEEIPTVLQYNKRDVAGAVSIEELHRYLNNRNLLWNEAIANKGTGVFDSLKQISKLVVDEFNRKYLQPGAARSRYMNYASQQQQQVQQQQVQQQQVQQQQVQQQQYRRPAPPPGQWPQPPRSPYPSSTPQSKNNPADTRGSPNPFGRR
jgi:signal recognition particle receptor subunit beta